MVPAEVPRGRQYPQLTARNAIACRHWTAQMSSGRVSWVNLITCKARSWQTFLPRCAACRSPSFAALAPNPLAQPWCFLSARRRHGNAPDPRGHRDSGRSRRGWNGRHSATVLYQCLREHVGHKTAHWRGGSCWLDDHDVLTLRFRTSPAS